ncbi:pilus assembly PilX N-terminal domain-containing protein, partial [Patescibacteria group bacterium]|nr:pilus assembly PilX N-terminal domain-containing protein [Patescibacteria group bacterium]
MFHNKENGFIITYILVFAVIFAILLTALLGFILSQMRISKYEVASEQALYIAEAGLNRYRWYLIHQSQGLLAGDELGCPLSDCSECEECEYEFDLPGVGVIGGYTLAVEEVRPCGITTAVTVTAEAWTNDFPNSKRKVKLRYIKPSVADYSYILNYNVWAGSDRVITGPYHSNGGIRMDGENNSLVSSEQSEWICTSSYGCSPCPSECNYISGRGCVCPGVFTTANGQEDLFVVNANHFDFEGITVNLNQIKGFTKDEDKGLYLPPSGKLGYHVMLNSRQLIVRKILALSRVWAYNEELGNFWEYSIISQESAPEYYAIDDCGLAFIEDNVWIEGGLAGKLTLVSADLINEEIETNVWLKGDIEYL